MKNLINLLSLNLFVLMLGTSCTGTHKLGMQKGAYEQEGQFRRMADGDEKNEVKRNFITLKCLGPENSKHVYLDGYTKNGTVKLAPTNEGHYTGTHWQVERLGDNSFALRCLGPENSAHVYLDGVTTNGTVRLVPTTAGEYTGTHWREELLDDGSLAFKCLGTGVNPAYVYLDAFTADGTVKLAPMTAGHYTGTHWQVGRGYHMLRVTAKYERY